METYWPIPGNQKDDLLRLADNFQQGLHKEKIVVPPRQYMTDTIARQLVKLQVPNEASVAGQK